MPNGFSEEWLTQHKAKIAAGRAAPEPPKLHLVGGGSNATGQGQTASRGTPGEKPRIHSRDAPLEGPLQIAAAEYLELALPEPLRFFHVPNGELRDPAVAGKLKAMGVKEGVADILILGFHPFIWIELKSAKGRLRPSQKAWRDWCLQIGAPWFLCRSLEDLVDALESLQIRLKVRL